tara:strand:+ start:1244 stop:1816 length:573 start_codon:yes stop_codon:yes gene_type:complete
MGFFDDVGDFFTKTIPRTVKKAARGVKSVGEKAVRGVKSAVKEVKRGVKEIGDNYEQFGDPRAWQEGFKKAGQLVQAPMKAIEKWDKEKGLGSKMGDWSGFSPLTLGAGAALAIPTGVGYFTELIGNKEKQKKLASGDADEIMNASFAGLGVVPLGAIGSGVKAVGRAGKAGVKGARGLFKGAKKLKLRR